MNQSIIDNEQKEILFCETCGEIRYYEGGDTDYYCLKCDTETLLSGCCLVDSIESMNNNSVEVSDCCFDFNSIYFHIDGHYVFDFIPRAMEIKYHYKEVYHLDYSMYTKEIVGTELHYNGEISMDNIGDILWCIIQWICGCNAKLIPTD